MFFQEAEECASDLVLSDVKSEITCKSSEEADSGDEVPEPSPDAQIHDIRCGMLVGRLHMNKFTCPGIHRRCIEFEGKLISPRQFTIKAEKDKQKDWKGSIRLGRYNLRTLMELKTFDFFEHETNCSLKCQSRNYIKNRKGEGNDMLTFFDSSSDNVHSTSDYDNGFYDDIGEPKRKGSSVLEDYVTQTVPSINGNAALACIGLRSEDIGFPTATQPQINVSRVKSDSMKFHQTLHNDNTATSTNLNNNNGNLIPPVIADIGGDAALAILLQSLLDQQQQQQAHNNRPNFLNNMTPAFNNNQTTSRTPAHNSAMQSLPVSENGTLRNQQAEDRNTTANVGNIRKIMESSPALFWSRMKEMGILEDLLGTLSTAVDQLKHIYLHGGTGTEEFAAQKLSSLANTLDLGLLFGEKIHARYMQATLESSLLTKELQDLQRRAEEQKRKLEHAKRKSQVFDQIIKNAEPDVKKMHLNISDL